MYIDTWYQDVSRPPRSRLVVVEKRPESAGGMRRHEVAGLSFQELTTWLAVDTKNIILTTLETGSWLSGGPFSRHMDAALATTRYSVAVSVSWLRVRSILNGHSGHMIWNYRFQHDRFNPWILLFFWSHGNTEHSPIIPGLFLLFFHIFQRRISGTKRQVMVPWHVKLRRAPSPAAAPLAWLRSSYGGHRIGGFTGKG